VLDAVGADLAEAERVTLDRLHEVGARLLEAELARRGTGEAGPRQACPCGAVATFECHRPKGVQTLEG
jgi:hypothetical protein